MSRYVWGYLYWGGGWLLLGFLAAELLGFYGLAPWPTLSATVWHSIRTYPPIGPIVFATLVALIAHFLYERPLWHSVVFGVAIAAAAHLADKHL